jgi:hypothetical protein
VSIIVGEMTADVPMKIDVCVCDLMALTNGAMPAAQLCKTKGLLATESSLNQHVFAVGQCSSAEVGSF